MCYSDIARREIDQKIKFFAENTIFSTILTKSHCYQVIQNTKNDDNVGFRLCIGHGNREICKHLGTKSQN